MKSLRLAGFAALIALASCGRVADLQPVSGHALPVKPMMARTTPSAKDLLTPPTYARPDRVDALIRRSQPRAPDPFDLPPPTGGAAPPQPAPVPEPAIDNSTSITPGD